MIEITDTQKIGVGLAGFGMTFLFLGVLLLFDKGLLAIGNILFISGLACVIGLQRTFFFFFQRHKVKASVAFFGGISIVLLGWPMIGMIAEMYGFLLLFRGFLPAAVNFLRMVPVLGSLLNLPIIRGIVDRIAGDNGRNMVGYALDRALEAYTWPLGRKSQALLKHITLQRWTRHLHEGSTYCVKQLPPVPGLRRMYKGRGSLKVKRPASHT
nr:vesicle transport protein GOT1B isoform X1 [Danaus plexippus plexippus]